MKKREYGIMIVLLLCVFSIGGFAWAIDWIQHTERLVGEGSPNYPTDVINRPAKQIWASYTSEHHPDGTHKALSSFPTPLPTATPMTFPTPLPTATPLPMSQQVTIYTQTTQPDIPNNTFAVWVDTYANQTWLLHDYNGAQKKVELLP